MAERQRFKQCLSLSDRLKIFSDQLKAEASRLRPSPEREALLQRARTVDNASNINEWARSPGLRPPQ